MKLSKILKSHFRGYMNYKALFVSLFLLGCNSGCQGTTQPAPPLPPQPSVVVQTDASPPTRPAPQKLAESDLKLTPWVTVEDSVWSVKLPSNTDKLSNFYILHVLDTDVLFSVVIEKQNGQTVDDVVSSGIDDIRELGATDMLLAQIDSKGAQRLSSRKDDRRVMQYIDADKGYLYILSFSTKSDSVAFEDLTYTIFETFKVNL